MAYLYLMMGNVQTAKYKVARPSVAIALELSSYIDWRTINLEAQANA